MTNKQKAAIAGAVIAIGTTAYLLLQPSPKLTVTAIPQGVELSWYAKTNEFYSLSYTPDMGTPWQEIWRGCHGHQPAYPDVAGEVKFKWFPRTSDSNSVGGCWMFWTNSPQPSNHTLTVYVSTTNETKGFFRLVTQTDDGPIAIPTLKIAREGQ